MREGVRELELFSVTADRAPDVTVSGETMRTAGEKGREEKEDG